MKPAGSPKLTNPTMSNRPPAYQRPDTPIRVGYARVSTEDQHLDLQLRALEAAGCAIVFHDQGISGASRERPALKEALQILRAGDVLLTWKLDRLGRSLQHLIGVITELGARGIGFQSLTEQMDTATPTGMLQFHLMGAMAEFERALISDRTKAGMAAARVRGARLGRPRNTDKSV